MAKFWIERTDTSSADRLKGERAIGKALWADCNSQNGKNLLKIKEGDHVVHIVDDRLKHISVVKSKFVHDIKGLKGHKIWDENCDCYLLSLWEPTNINNTFNKDDYLNKIDKDLLLLISETSTTFYSKSLSFKSNQFITPCSKELLTYLYWKFFDLHNKTLPGVSKKYIYPADLDLYEYIKTNKSRILKENSYARKIDSSEKSHNNVIDKLCNGFIDSLNFDRDKVKKLVPTVGSGDIDLFLSHEKTAIIIECKTRKKPTDLLIQIKTFYGRMEEYENFIRKNPDVFGGDFDNFKFIFVPYKFDISKLNELKNKLIDQGYSKINLNDGTDNKRVFNILHNNTIRDLFFDLGNEIDQNYAKREFLKNIFVEPIKTNRIEIPAIETKYDKFNLYTFTCSAKQLTQFATVSRKYIGASTYKSYQRRLNGKRLSSISKFINEGNNFINNIIIKFNENAVDFIEYEYNEESAYTTFDTIRTGILKVTPLFHSCFVIDGQHRLFSFLKANKDTNIPVSALVGVNEREEVNFFININDKAESVSADLIWDLHGDMKTNKSEGIISNTVKKLCVEKNENSIFYKNIRIPSLETSGFSFSGLCKNLHTKLKIMNKEWRHLREKNTIVKNPLYNSNHEILTVTLYNEIDKFFLNLNSNLKYELKYIFELRNEKKSLFDGTIVEVLCRLFKYYHIYNLTHKVKLEEYVLNLAEVFNSYSNEKIKDIKQKSGQPGKLETEKGLIRDLNKIYPDLGPNYKDVLGEEILKLYKTELADWVNNQLVEFNEDWKDGKWIKDLFKSNNDAIYKKHLKDSNHDGRQIHRLIGWDQYKEIILSKGPSQKFNLFDKIFNDKLFIEPRNGFTSETDLMNCFEQIGRYRNMIGGHGNSDNWTEDKKGKVKQFYQQLKSLLV